MFFGLCLCILLISSFLSLVFYNKMKEAGDYLKQANGIEIRVKFVYFNPFKGLVIKRLECREGGEIFFKTARLDAGFDLMSLLQRKKISIKNIESYHSHLFLNKMARLSMRGRNPQNSGLDAVLSFFETVHFKAKDVWLNDALNVDFSGYLSVIKQKFFISKGKVFLKVVRIPGVFSLNLLSDNRFNQAFDYAVEVESQEDNLAVSRCELSSSFLGISGSGQIEDYKKDSARISLHMNSMNAILDDLPFMNSASLQSRGFLDIAFAMTGPVNNPDISSSVKLTNAQFTFSDSLSFEKINGSLVFSRNQLAVENFCFSANDMPLCCELNCFFEDSPRILFKLFTPGNALGENSFILDLKGIWLDRNLFANLDLGFRYFSKEKSSKLNFTFKGFHLGYKNGLFFESDWLQASLNSEPSEADTNIHPFSQDLIFKQIFSTIKRTDEYIALDDLRAVCYGGVLNGKIRFSPRKETLSVMGSASMRDIDLSRVFQQSERNVFLLTGRLSGDFGFNTELSPLLKGDFCAVDGSLAQSSLLNAVADFLGVSSLKEVVFNKLNMSFAGSKGDYISKVRLFSPKVNAVLDGKVFGYDKIDGYLLVTLATDLLNESKQFKKILTLIRHSESNVVFPFKISSYVDSPRVIWLKNEFKEKLQNLLPESNKRYLQEQLNGMVEKMAEE